MIKIIAMQQRIPHRASRFLSLVTLAAAAPDGARATRSKRTAIEYPQISPQPQPHDGGSAMQQRQGPPGKRDQNSSNRTDRMPRRPRIAAAEDPPAPAPDSPSSPDRTTASSPLLPGGADEGMDFLGCLALLRRQDHDHQQARRHFLHRRVSEHLSRMMQEVGSRSLYRARHHTGHRS